jgi:Methyltransferase domain
MFSEAWRNRAKALIFSVPIPSSRLIYNLEMMTRFRRWTRQHASDKQHFDSREQLYDFVNQRANGPITLLEFGVYQGESMRTWLALNQHPKSMFHGFDSFEGLPEDWQHMSGWVTPKGAFGVKGEPPSIHDSRLTWHKGWYQETLPTFLKGFGGDGQLVIHMDSDLYSSTLYVLTQLAPVLSDSLMVFDDFSSINDEFRAVCDFKSAFRRDYEVLACGGIAYSKVAIRWR